MQDLLKSLQEKIGLTAEQAKNAASHMLDYVKSKLPAALHDHIDNAANGQAHPDAAGTSGIMDKASDLAHKAEEKAESFLKDTAGKISGMFGNSKV